MNFDRFKNVNIGDQIAWESIDMKKDYGDRLYIDIGNFRRMTFVLTHGWVDNEPNRRVWIRID